jgi:hypothetical protein
VPAPGGNPPCITIRQTPFNDLYLMLDMLLPSAQTARILRDPSGFARSQEESLRTAWQLIRRSFADEIPEGDRKPENDADEPGNAVQRRRRPARQDRISSRILLR